MKELFTLLIYSLAPQYDINPQLALSVAKTESSLNHLAIGPFKEVGLFQVRPEYSKFTATELLLPIVNVTEGLRILSEAKRKCKSTIEFTFVNCFNLGLRGGSKLKYPKLFPYYVKIMENMNDTGT